MSDAGAPSAIRRTRRQRRPTGAPPPLPRRIGPSTTAWLALAAIGVSAAFLVSELTPWLRAGDQASTWLLRQLAAVRTPWLTDLANWINAAVEVWHPLIGVAVVLLVIVFRRWRHLLVFTACVFFLEIVVGLIYAALSRPRPYGVPIIGRWGGYAAPSPTVMAVTFLLMAAVYCVVVPGRPRSLAKAVAAAIVAVFCLARLYLALDHPDDVLFGVALGVAVPVAAFRFFTPDEVFGVSYRRGRTAHVDVTGRRGAAIRQAIHDQLGLTVLDIKPVGLESSAGSTPLRLTVEGDPGECLFGKLYTLGHVRADRWYKLWRTILYGALEDEHPFHSVRQLTQYEDYVLRLLRDAGVRSATPHGIVEITPEREYLLVTEFFAGAVELGDADVDDDIIDQGLLLVRNLWDAGLAHRDIKPGNLMVRDSELLLIDAGFAQVRPSPWRQAVDLGNMMLVLAVRTDAGRVYRRALSYFTPDELAEAFAATRGVASPTQLRAFMKRDPRDLLGEFRALAPPRRPIVAAALGRPAGDRRRGDARRRRGGGRAHRHRVPFSGGFRDRRPVLRHRPLHDLVRAGCAVGRDAAVHRGAALGLDRRRRRHHQRPVRVLAGLRPGRPAGAHRQPDRDVPHLRSRADPVRPPRSGAFRAPAEPAAAVHADADVHLRRRMRHLPVRLRPGRGPPAGHPAGHRGRVRAEVGSGPVGPADRGPGALRPGGRVLGPDACVGCRP